MWVCVGVCVHFFEEARKDFSPSGEEKKREKKEGKENLTSWFISFLFWLSYLYFVRNFKRSAEAVISTQFQIIIDILIMCTEEYLIAYYKFKTRFSTFSVKQVLVFHLKQ